MPRPSSSLPIASPKVGGGLFPRLGEGARHRGCLVEQAAARFALRGETIDGARERLDLARHALARRGDRRRVAAVLAQKFVHEKEAFLDLAQALGVGLDAVGVAAERARHVDQVAARSFRPTPPRGERGIESRDGGELAAQARQLVADGAVFVVEAVGGAARHLPEPFGMAQAAAIGLELGELAWAQPHLVDGRELETRESFALFALLLQLLELGDLARARDELIDEARELVAVPFEAGEGVEVQRGAWPGR